MYKKALKFALEAKEKRNKKMIKAGTYMSALFPHDEFYFDFGRRTGKTTFIKEFILENKENKIVVLVPHSDYLKSFDEVMDFATVYSVDDIKEKLLGINVIDILFVDDASEIENLKEVISSISNKFTSETMVIKVG